MIDLCKPKTVLKISTTSRIEVLDPPFTLEYIVDRDASAERKDLSRISIACFLKLRLVATVDVIAYPLHSLDLVGR